MKVAISVQSNYPVDRQVRTKKFAKYLDRDGEDVVIYARNTSFDPARGQADGEDDPVTEHLPYGTVRRFSWGWTPRLATVLRASVPLNPFWFLWLVLQFVRDRPDVVIVDGIRAGIPTALAAKLVGVPVVFDLRENYVGLANSLPSNSRVGSILQHERLVWGMERATIALADQTWVVVEERREQLVEKGISPSRLVVVSNTPDLEEIPDETTETAAVAADGGALTLVYVGVLNEFRGLGTILDAMAELNHESDPHVRFVVAGDGPHKSALEAQAERLGVDEHVRFLGWVDSEAVPQILASADVGVIPHEVSPLTDLTVPNKLFDYMMLGLPVLATAMAPVERIVEEENCGVVLPPATTPSQTADRIRELSESDQRALGENGRRAVEDRYNWSREMERVRASLDSVVRAAR
ncbi:glycosyltransferase family 4 protein [Halogeometricum limi]|uniref:Glycosyltransferase involved in cell wall bisynthesis n=1 Tax=Halogeometricum limi TaxID=555875 RepID=A0A1I6IJS0_9EURY|nr:glycosyltransferase family 4 protein [Halogeometricum limi]SFR66975.1 Glycosyltransferase involved in cell wall bisynthesis [Halogeometricum limi]